MAKRRLELEDVALNARDARHLMAQRPHFLLDLSNLLMERRNDQTMPIVSPQPCGEREYRSCVSHSDAVDLIGRDTSSLGRYAFQGEGWYRLFLAPARSDGYNPACQQSYNNGCRSRSSLSSISGKEMRSVHERSSMTCELSDGPADTPPRESRDRLVEAYFQRFHKFWPIIQKSKFMREMEQGTLSIALLRSVLFIATVHCDAKVLYRIGYESRHEANIDFFEKAKAEFDAGLEQDRFTGLQVSFLLHHWWGQPNSSRDFTWWLAGAINVAQTIGMNWSSAGSHLTEDLKKMWRRTWWLLYVSNFSEVGVSR